jgi:release factor glutamine methyltransferase
LTILEALSLGRLDPRESRLLLAEAAGLSEVKLIAFPEMQISVDAEKRFAEFIARRARGEPIAYILGRKEFYGVDLEVTPATLVPRPETELLVELSLQRAFSSVADLGTGSGAIAVALKKHRSNARVVAVEASAAALQVARKNAMRLGLDVEFRHGRWFEPLANERFDLIVSNPPYVAAADPHLHDLRFEPQEALVAGIDGLDALREIAGQARDFLLPGGWLLLEHGMGQDRSVRALLGAAGLEDVASWPDLAGIPRVTGGKR